jgi:hypothetical protein
MGRTMEAKNENSPEQLFFNKNILSYLHIAPLLFETPQMIKAIF